MRAMYSSNGVRGQLAFALWTSLACTAAPGCSSSDTTQSGDVTHDGGVSGTTANTSVATTHGASTSSTTSTSTGPSTTTGQSTSGGGAASGTGGASAGSDGSLSNNNGSNNGNSNHSTGATLSTTGAGGASASGSTDTISSTGAGDASTSSGGSVFPPSVTAPRIMIVGDSISAGPGCYKKYLVEHLGENGITDYEFVGEYDDDCGGGVKHSAVSCTTSDQYAQSTFTVPNCFGEDTFPGMSELVLSHDPDLIMLQLGVNDVWGGSTPIEPILNNYATLIGQARAHNPNVVFVVARIHKIITDNCQNAASTANAEALVMALPEWALGVSTPESPVMIADLWTNSDAHEADDCVHPNEAGARRMGLNWYNALADVLR